MRREQILKICLNHAITPELIFKAKDEKSWLWAAQDFTEGEGKMETFVIRFRDAETSKAFMNAVKENKVTASFLSQSV
jgi:E3 SUMO-protein ligase RanBP2